MEVIKSYIVRHENGMTILHHLKNDCWVLVVPTPVKLGIWNDVYEFIPEHKAEELIKEMNP